MDFSELEATEALRFSWNAWPSSRIEANRSVVPFGVVWTPLQAIADMPVVSYPPVSCKGCEAILNPYCTVDYGSKSWSCPWCFQVSAGNSLPLTAAEVGTAQQQSAATVAILLSLQPPGSWGDALAHNADMWVLHRAVSVDVCCPGSQNKTPIGRPVYRKATLLHDSCYYYLWFAEEPIPSELCRR